MEIFFKFMIIQVWNEKKKPFFEQICESQELMDPKALFDKQKATKMHKPTHLW